MSVYVDSAFHRYGRMKMCHMLADTSEELHAMATRIGVPRKWVQHEGTPREHYDICSSARQKALVFGAQVVDSRGIAEVLRRKRRIA